MRLRSSERGETLVEVVMALAILSLVLVSAYVLATTTFRLGRGAGERTQAVNLLQEQAEALRSYRNTAKWDGMIVDVATRIPLSPGAIEQPFCMIKTSGAWGPTTDMSKCNPAPYSIKIVATENESPPKNPPDSVKFTISAAWKTGPDDNKTSIVTILTNPDAN